MSANLGLLRLRAFPMMHEMHAKSYRVWSKLSINPSELRIRYKIEAAHPKEFAKVILPDPAAKPGRKDELWKGTCFEAFIPARDSSAYLEFNGSPDGNWNWYSFKEYRKGMKEFPINPESLPKQSVQSRSDSSIDCEWTLPVSGIRQGFLSAGQNSIQFDQIGICVVLNTTVATTYWALSHEGIKPDFHLRPSWTATWSSRA